MNPPLPGQSGHAHTRAQEPSRLIFALTALGFFVALLSAAASVGLVPYYIDGTEPTRSAPRDASAAPIVVTDLAQLQGVSLTLTGAGTITAPTTRTDAAASTGVAPTRIVIPAIDLDLAVQNPETTDVEVLDELLKDGPARFASSAKLAERGNMIIFAHSSNLPIVHNKMYKAFNRIPELMGGETITLVAADGSTHLYRVVSVEKVDINDDVSISLARSSTRLTLVTCDTLAGKSARFVLDAEYVGIL